MSNNFNLEDTRHVAQLCALNLSQEELAKLTEMFSGTLDYVALLDKLDTSGVSETSQVTGLKNVFQTIDMGRLTLEQGATLKNADKVRDKKFVTKAVFNR